MDHESNEVLVSQHMHGVYVHSTGSRVANFASQTKCKTSCLRDIACRYKTSCNCTVSNWLAQHVITQALFTRYITCCTSQSHIWYYKKQ
jgi:hypothetical protein